MVKWGVLGKTVARAQGTQPLTIKEALFLEIMHRIRIKYKSKTVLSYSRVQLEDSLILLVKKGVKLTVIFTMTQIPQRHLRKNSYKNQWALEAI